MSKKHKQKRSAAPSLVLVKMLSKLDPPKQTKNNKAERSFYKGKVNLLYEDDGCVEK